MAVIAIDLGTTGCKAAVFDGAAVLGSAYRYHHYDSPEDGWAQQDPEEAWELVDAAVRQALTLCKDETEIQAICVSVQGDAIIPIDSAGRSLHPAILGMDTRSHVESADLQKRFGRGQLYSWTGMPCEPLNSITKIAWLIRNCTGIQGKVWKFTHYEDFLLMKLSGVPALSFTMASRTGAFDPVRKDWNSAILDFCGLQPGQLGNVSPSGSPIGIIRNSVADAWGISRDALVVTGGHDQTMAAVGAGVIEPDLACYSMGTAEVIGTCFPRPNISAAMLERNYPCYCHAAAGQYFTISLNQSGGLSLDWFQRQVLDAGDSGDNNATLQHHLQDIECHPSPVLFLPHIVGSGTPTCDILSRGSFFGLSLKTGRREMFQAVVDSLAFEARLNIEQLDLLDIHVAELRGVGGGARSQRLLEIKATVLNRPIRTLQNPEASLLGAALLAQVAIGRFSSLEEACRECVRIDDTIEPCRDAVEAYGDAYGRFRELYALTKSFYHHWRTEWPTLLSV